MPETRLTEVSREDVARMAQWLQDPEVRDSWYGADDAGEPMHIGYSPQKMAEAPEEEWKSAFQGETRKVYSIYDSQEGHVGECQLLIEPPLHEAQIFIIIGRKDLWLKHFGSAALLQLLDIAFYTYKLHRVWADIPEYNSHAIHMFERMGFMLEGHLRSTHPKEGKWYDSIVMGLLENEYARRRPKLTAQVNSPAA
ncbi:MAG: GNAT family N-acetyltransferase [SAR202 cluster bacterium]|nr:GNAT family N-acetyltransferase [SAR202 cluster bacterium]